MYSNVGTKDRWLRMLAGAALLLLTFVGPRSLWGLTGLLLLTTAAVAFCPAYSLFGWSTAGQRGGRGAR